MTEKIITLIRGDAVDSTVDYRDSLPVNAAAILRPILGADGYLLQNPGLTQYATGQGVDRGGVWNSRFNAHYRVSGGDLIEVSETGTVTVLASGAGSTTGTQAALPYSFTNQAIVLDGIYYLYNSTDGIRQITSPVDYYFLDAVWVDSYFFFTDGGYLYTTTLADEGVLDPLTYATSAFSPDLSLGLGLTTDDKVIVFNRYTTEFFENTAAEFFAFTRIPARNVQYGIAGTNCKTSIGGDWYFLGGAAETNNSIYKLGVGTAQNISTREVDKVIASYSDTQHQAAHLEIRVYDDYQFLIVYLPNDTLMCNLNLLTKIGPDQAWSILKSGNTAIAPYRAVYGIFDPRSQKWCYGDLYGSTIGFLDESVATHYENLVECAIYTPFIYLETASIDEVEIVTIPGFNSVDDASVFFSLTYDGITFTAEVPVNYGAPSQYNQRFIIRRVGYVRNYFSLKYRWASTSRMAFATAKLRFS